MQSTVNYLWHTDDLLGQGATASVYKARNKVGARPEVGPQWASGLGLSGQAPLICSEEGQGCGGLKRASGVMPIGHALGLEREGRRREPTSRGAGGKSRNSRGAGGPIWVYSACIALRAVLDT